MPTSTPGRRRFFYGTVSICCVLATVAIVFAGEAIHTAREEGRSSRLRLCREEQKTRMVIRAILEDARAASQQNRQARRFYDRQIGRVARLDCQDIINGD